MKHNSKKEIRKKVEATFVNGLEELKLAQLSKKTRKLVSSAAKRISRQLKTDMKRESRKVFSDVRKEKQ